MAPLTAAARLGLELRRLRRRQGLSQRGLVRALGLSAHSNLVQYEQGRRIPPGDIVTACERLLGDDAGVLRRLRAEALAERAEAERETAFAAGTAPTPATVPGVGALPEAEHGATPVPAMLPAAVADFTGRAAELARLAKLADDDAAPAVVVTAIAGTAGVGKTALAVRFAHEVRHRFPDGQLYVDLRGYAPTPPLAPSQALAILLHALGVAAGQVPTQAERAAGMYRSLLAGKRMLVVLDNAHRADQVRPLLPGTRGCLVLVTSRDGFGGLIAREGARRLTLDVLSPAEAHALLARILGRDRVAAEAEAADELARRCALLPLALRIAAANLADQPHRSIADYTTELRTERGLKALAVSGDEQGAVRVAFASSYARLAPPARRLFRLLGLVPGPDIVVEAAAALAGITPREAADILARLAGAHLVTEHAPGRFACHDLLRRYAAERAGHDEADTERTAAATRLYDWYLAGAAAAAHLLYPTMVLLPLPPARVAPPEFATDGQALAWLDAERPNLLAAVQQAAAAPRAVGGRPHPAAWLLADALRGYFWLRLYTADWLTTARAGLAAAQAAGEPRAEIVARLSLADAYQCQGRHREALTRYLQVLELARRDGWVAGQVTTLNGLGRVYRQLDRLKPAAEHLSEALALDVETGAVRGQATRLANLGAIYYEMGRLAMAADHFARALAITRETGQRRGGGICLANLGMTDYEMRRFDSALDRLTQALTVARETGDLGNEAHVLRVMAEVHGEAGRLDRALDLALAAVEVADGIDDPHFAGETMNTLAGVLARRGAVGEAVDRYARALKLARETGSRYPEIVALIGLAGLDCRLDQPEQGLTGARTALELARKAGYRVLEGHAFVALAKAYHALDQPDEAVRHARRAVAVYRHTGHRLGETRALAVLGEALVAAGRTRAADRVRRDLDDLL